MLAWLFDNAHYWPFTLACIVALIPFERVFPRIVKPVQIRMRTRSILVIAAFSIGTSHLVQIYLQDGMIMMFAPLKLLSIAKLNFPPFLIFSIGFLFLDFLTYAIHRLSHRVTVLWRLHAIHHSDEHVTALSAVLHHPFETLANFTLVMFFSVIVGVPILVLVIYSFVGAAHNAFAHADIVLPHWIDRPLRYLVVTPDIHRTHHSARFDEGNSNFGQIFTIWDRLLGTYIDRPTVPEPELKMGLPDSEKSQSFSISALLALPFVNRHRN